MVYAQPGVEVRNPCCGGNIAVRSPDAGLHANDKAPVVLLRSLEAAATRPVHIRAVSRAAEPPMSAAFFAPLIS
jgi:hypothetical protein